MKGVWVNILGECCIGNADLSETDLMIKLPIEIEKKINSSNRPVGPNNDYSQSTCDLQCTSLELIEKK